MFTRHSLNDPTQQEVVASWRVQLWLFNFDSSFYDIAPTSIPDEPTSVHVPPNALEDSIATL
jgi:hypothetical protein